MKRTWLLVATLAFLGCSTDSSTVATPEASVDGAPDANGQGSADPTSSSQTVAIEDGAASLSAENTKIQFVGTHMPPREPEPRTGVFEDFSGSVEVDVEAQQLKSISVDIKTESLTTPIERLTNHLRSPDFLDVDNQLLVGFFPYPAGVTVDDFRT